MRTIPYLAAALLSVASFHIAPAQERIERLFHCADTLHEPYGVCEHISMASDYALRDNDLRVAKALGINWLRSDFTWEDHHRGGNFHPTYSDGTEKSVNAIGIHFLPILGQRVGGKLSWEDKDAYVRFADWLMKRHGKSFAYWEMQNEIDIAWGAGKNAEDIANKYATILPDMKRLATANGVKIVMGGMAACYGTFLSTLAKNGALSHVDVMNFHHYSNCNAPESAYYSYAQTANTMKSVGANMETWLTETGFHTEQSTKDAAQFFDNVLPKALTSLGIGKGATVAVVADGRNKVWGATEQQCEFLRERGYALRFVTLDEVGYLSVAETPVLLPTCDESFPLRYADQLVDYVRRGGTIVVSYGAPFYYDISSDGKRTMIGDAILKRLHMQSLFWWDENMKKAGLPTLPTVIKKSDAYRNVDYDWKVEGEGTTRYLGEGNMRPGDVLIPIVSAGTEKRQWVVSGIYSLNSDMKGNIVFHTNSQLGLNVTERLQAKRVARTYITAFAAGISKVFWYNLRSYETDARDMECHFGLTHSDLSPKPAYHAFKTMTDNLPDGSTRPEVTCDKEQGLYTATWRRPDGRNVTAYWTSMAETTVRLLRSLTNARAVDYMGNEIRLDGRKLTVSNSVVYLVER